MVGPRPHATKMDDDYATRIPSYNRRFEILPGITGLAQVRGQRGITDTMDKIAARIASGIEYVEIHGFWGDLIILLRTVLGRRNAGWARRPPQNKSPQGHDTQHTAHTAAAASYHRGCLPAEDG